MQGSQFFCAVLEGGWQGSKNTSAVYLWNSNSKKSGLFSITQKKRQAKLSFFPMKF